MDLVFLTDPEHVGSLFRRSTELTSAPNGKFVSSTFGVRTKSPNLFAADDTGLSRVPLPDSYIKPEHRVNYLMHTFIVQLVTGKSLKPLAQRFTRGLQMRLRSVNEGDPFACLYDSIKVHMLHASVSAMFGKHLLEVDPDFSDRFWEFEKGMPELVKGFPRFIYPRQYKAWDICLASICTWQHQLSERRLSDPDAAFELSRHGYDNLFFGSQMIMKRHSAFSHMEAMDAEARASEDLALLWGSHANAIYPAFWLIYSTVRDTSTQHRFLKEIRHAKLQGLDDGLSLYDIDTLCSSPFLQSVYAETLRLYVTNIILRSPRNTDFSVGGWYIRIGEGMSVMGFPMHRSEA